MSVGHDLLGGPPPTYLPIDTGALTALAARDSPDAAVRAYPTSSLAWAALSDQAWAAGAVVESYAFARVGYHRGLDALRRAGWKGHGPVPWDHEPNQGFLRCLRALGRAAAAINEIDEAERISAFLLDCDPNIPAA
ncbi:unannotated protein [freshwater metagenome]|uniref:Unannotated protein n=1 Tax=freshwater metagenome TaxID=449393 RepID=A0A6J6MKF9_9ZZZZ|nr:DUF3151 family protein [Actinomycetota bacterium]